MRNRMPDSDGYKYVMLERDGSGNERVVGNMAESG